MPARYIPALVFLIALTAATIYFYNDESSFIEGMSVAQGEVVALGSRSTSSSSINGRSSSSNTQALVDFEVNGKLYRVDGRAMGYPEWTIGQKVEVYYSPEKPATARIKRWDELYFLSLICAFFISTSLVFSLVNFVVYKVRGKPLS